MLSSESSAYLPTVYLLKADKRRFKCVLNFFIAQCCLVFIGALTVFHCLWDPNRLPLDYYKLACVMYLFDRSACGYSTDTARSVKNLRFSNDTMGLDVLPIRWRAASVTVTTRLSSKTRGHLEISVAIHLIWMLLALIARFIARNNDNPKMLRYILTAMFYSSIFVVAFDLSMSIVYVAHIKQSLTKGMIIRYSGWTVELKDINYNDFGGWLPIAASLAWMRGGIIVALNIYCCRTLYYLSQKIKRKISKRNVLEHKYPIPEANRVNVTDDRVLFFRPGELKPDSGKDFTESYY